MVTCITMVNNSCQQEEEWRKIFNGENLDNWEMNLGTSLGSNFDSLAAQATVDKVFSIAEKEGEKIIRISGEINGSLATKETFSNYHLRMVFKWGETVFSSRNSGLLYHSFGDFGVTHGTWMTNIEFQLKHENIGDTYLMVNTCCETAARKDEEKDMFFYTPGAEIMAFGEHANGKSIKKSQNAENPLGEWNTLDLFCFGTKAVHVVNGVTVMVNNNTGVFENGVVKPLSEGKIQLQSEGAELYIKSMDIRNIKSLPESI